MALSIASNNHHFKEREENRLDWKLLMIVVWKLLMIIVLGNSRKHNRLKREREENIIDSKCLPLMIIVFRKEKKKRRLKMACVNG